MLTARSHKLSPFVHAVDDAGAVCGARPRRRGWVPNTTLPITCARCLLRLSLPRYVYCGSPSSLDRRTTHIRLVGTEGITKTGGPGELKALCGRATGWDLELVAQTPRPGTAGICPGCVKELRRRRTGLPVSA